MTKLCSNIRILFTLGAYLCVCRLGSLQHVRDSASQVLGSTQKMLPISSFIIHECSQQFDTL